MALEKLAEQDGREVLLSVVGRPEDAASWASRAHAGAGVLAYLDGWSPAELSRLAAAFRPLKPSEVAFGGTGAAAAREAYLKAVPGAVCSAREDEPLDESVWYMFFASYEPDPSTRRQPPLIVAFRPGDARAEEFRSLCARFTEAMSDVLERE